MSGQHHFGLTSHVSEGAIVTIDYLANRPELADQLAKWSWKEWNWIYQHRGQSFDDSLKNYRERAQTESLPLALVAFAQNGEPIGTVSLKHNDLEIRPDITPCLGGMFVVPEWRRHGVASLLVRRILVEARRFGYESVYLWTDSSAAEALYLKLGWQVLERMDYAGKSSVTMVRSEL